jgi:rhamnogalacturonan hydrolase
MKSTVPAILQLALLLPLFVKAQLSGTVGPLTTRAAKAATKVCNILDYGGVASATTDNSAAITAAWAACLSGGEGISTLKFPLSIYITYTESLYSFWKLWSGNMDCSHWRQCNLHQFGGNNL